MQKVFQIIIKYGYKLHLVNELPLNHNELLTELLNQPQFFVQLFVKQYQMYGEKVVELVQSSQLFHQHLHDSALYSLQFMP